MYKVFVRNWWKVNQEWPNGLEPDSNARKTTIGHADSEDEAREMAQNYNATHKSGKLSRKAEFTKA